MCIYIYLYTSVSSEALMPQKSPTVVVCIYAYVYIKICIYVYLYICVSVYICIIRGLYAS